MRKLVIGIVAENNAGKSTAATIITDMGGIHYSMRDVIKKRYKELFNEEIPDTRDALSKFSQSQKSELGPHTFMAYALEKFIEEKPLSNCIVIESLRAPGEARWLINDVPSVGDYKPLLIGVTAPYEDRLHRFIQGGMGEIGGVLTEEGFKHHEEIATIGTTEWGENVITTLELATVVLSNPNGKIKTFDNKLRKFIRENYN